MARRGKVKGSTINRELACLKHLYALAIKGGENADNPVKQVNFFSENEKPMRILSYAEEIKLLDTCNDSLKPIIIIALETGMRRSEILSLKREQVDFDERSISAEDTKNGEFRIIPISSFLFAVRERLDRKSEYVFSRNGKDGIKSVRTAFENAVKRTGIPHIRFHDLRHTFGSRAVMSGVDLATVKELKGHKSINMTMRYAHPPPAHKRMAVELLRRNFFDSKVDSLETSAQEEKGNNRSSATIN